jgi:hypothetical protein
MCTLRDEAIAANPQVRAKLAEVNNNARSKFKDVCTDTGRGRLVQANMDKVKAENKSCSNWCIHCLLMRNQWPDEHDKGELWTEKSLKKPEHNSWQIKTLM